MSNIVKIKRGSGVPASGVLAAYELGWDYVNKSLYLGVANSNPIKIADAFNGYWDINTVTGKFKSLGNYAFEVDGAVDFNDTLTVDELTQLNAALNVVGLASLDGGINTNDKFTVASATGNTFIDGTLLVNGNSTLGDTSDDAATIRGTITLSDTTKTTTVKGLLQVDEATNIDGNFTINDSYFTVDSNNGNTVIAGTLTVNGDTELDAALGVDGIVSLRNNLNVTGNTVLTGTLTANNDIIANTNVTLGSDSDDIITINGTTTATADVTVEGLSSLDGGIDVNSKVTVNANTGNIVTSGDLTANNAVLNGNLTVHGTTTTVNSTTVEISDPIFTLGEALITSDAKDRGIEFIYGTTATPSTGFFGFNENTGRFTFIPSATNTSEVFTGLTGNYEIGEIYQPQTGGVYDSGSSTYINASARWNNAANAIMNGQDNGVQYDLLQADENGVFQPTKTISAASGITIDCGEY